MAARRGRADPLRGIGRADGCRCRTAVPDRDGEGHRRFFPERVDGDDKPATPQVEPDRRGEWIERLGWELAAIAGLDGERTLRELVWGAREKRRFAGELAAWHLSEIACRIPFGDGKRLDPTRINPYRVVKPKTPQMIALEQWQALANARVLAGLPVEPLTHGTLQGPVRP